MATGVIKFYRADKGWGAISSEALPPGRDAWFHFSHIDGDKMLTEGQRVEFEFEAVQQDSFEYRALWVRP